MLNKISPKLIPYYLENPSPRLKSLLNKSLMKMTLNEARQIEDMAARCSPQYASFLVFKKGLSGDVTDEFIKSKMLNQQGDIFDEKGKLNNLGQEVFQKMYFETCYFIKGSSSPWTWKYPTIGDYLELKLDKDYPEVIKDFPYNIDIRRCL